MIEFNGQANRANHLDSLQIDASTYSFDGLERPWACEVDKVQTCRLSSDGGVVNSVLNVGARSYIATKYIHVFQPCITSRGPLTIDSPSPG